jgi:hypothetical protein
LRQKLGRFGSADFIRTTPGIGYAFVDEEEAVPA